MVLCHSFRPTTSRALCRADDAPENERGETVNLLANGNFDEGEDSPAGWQQIDGLTSFWVDDADERRGKVMKFDTDVLQSQAYKWWDKLLSGAKAKDAPAKQPTVEPKYDTLAGLDGVWFYSDYIPVEQGKKYWLSLDVKGPEIMVWLVGYPEKPDTTFGADQGALQQYLQEQRGTAEPQKRGRRAFIHKYIWKGQLKAGGANEWKTYSRREKPFEPTKNTPSVRYVRVLLFPYWPPGTYYVDNVRLAEYTEPASVEPREQGMDPAKWGTTALFAIATAAAALSAPPNTVDLGPEFQKFGLTPLQQGARGDCSLFAITALVEFELARNAPDEVKRLSEEFLIWAAHAASATKADDQAMFYQAVHGLNVYGICTSKLMPYARTRELRRQPSNEALIDARARSERWKVHWIKRWDVKTGLSARELAEIKQALVHGHPVACGLRWPKKLDGHEILRVPPAQHVEDGHSIAFTGYQDDAKEPGGGVLFFRNSFGPHWGNHGYGVMSYAYAAAYGNDAVWLKLGAPHSEKPRVRFEAESLPVQARGRCECSRQDMKDWGRGMWSHGVQLVCVAKNGGFVQLGFKVHQAGKYRVRVLATAAPDYGKIHIALDGHSIGRAFDLYCGRVSPSGSLELGNHELAVGQHHLRFTVAGKNAASTGHLFGVDAIDLLNE